MGNEEPNAQHVFSAPLRGPKHRRTFEGKVDSTLWSVPWEVLNKIWMGPLNLLTCVITAHRRSHWIHFPKVEQLNRMLASKHQKLTGHIWFKWDQKEKHFPFDKNLKHLSNLNSLQGSGTTSSPIFYSNPSSITLSSINNNKKFPSGRILQIFSFLLFPCAHKSFSIELLFINLQQPWKEHDKKEFT